MLIFVAATSLSAGTLEDAEVAFGRDDYATALQLYRSIADQGDAAAQYHLGYMYYYGFGVPGNHTEGVKWYRLAAEQGNVKAQTLLGQLFAHDAVRAGDESIKWYSRAASQGDAEAQEALGMMYHDGRNVRQNYDEAAKWLHLAAEQGEFHAQFELALLYFEGEGVRQNYVRAYMWASLAAAKVGTFSEYRDTYIASRMTPAQIAEAQSLAAEWRPKPAKDSIP